MEKCGIYQIWCNRSGKFYVGSSCRIYSRWTQHRRDLRKKSSNCTILQKAWNKHGEEAFRFSILEECLADELEALEQHHIDTLRPAYNSVTDIKRRYGEEMLANRAAALRARAALITHCPRGHEYTEANTYRNKHGKRICRACNALRVSGVYASETPEQREYRRQRAKADHLNNREARLAVQREYVASHKAEKAAYDKARRERIGPRKRYALETPEQRAARLAKRREHYKSK